MIRLASLLLAFVMTAGPSTTYFCMAWCSPQTADHSCCATGTTSEPQLQAGTSCDPATTPAMTATREETNRAAAPQHGWLIATGATSGSTAALLCRVRLPGDRSGRSHSFIPALPLRI